MLLIPKNITPKKRFLRFAFPCTYLLEKQNRITKEKIKELENIILTDQEPTEELLKTTFTTAYEQLKKIDYKNPFREETIETYFLKKHNDFVNTRETVPEVLKEYCRIQEGVVKKFSEDPNYVKIKYCEAETKEHLARTVSRIWIPKLEIGDNVRIHYWYVVEKIQ